MFRIKINIKRGRKNSLILFAIALIALIVTDIIGNLYLSGLAVVFGLAALAAELTEIFLNWKERKKGDK
ncbi:hypothetical protein A9498_26960 [Bacillus thuringiensis serovar coreanensis]|nr:hypothetical protein A9498_26960 [Bacillus thuringiensis serovar coreanensis]MEB8648309.1 hypothetical protein [Bacillus cereus]MEB8665788.1 hypothetical protein [Bacillus cereus]